MSVRKPAAKPKAATKKPAQKAARSSIDLYELGARVVSVFGPFSSKTMVLMSTDLAEELFPAPLRQSGRTTVVEAAEHDVASVRERDRELGDSALAAATIALAYEIEHPYNSATSKSMCAREMRDTLDRLRELVPPAAREDGIDELKKHRENRRTAVAPGGTRAKNQKRP